MKRKIVIFDMDGTVLDTLEDLKNGLNFALRTCGYAGTEPGRSAQFCGERSKKTDRERCSCRHRKGRTAAGLRSICRLL